MLALAPRPRAARVEATPRFRFDEGLEVRMPEPGAVDIKLLRGDDEVLEKHVDQPTDCSMPLRLEVPEL